MHIKELSGGSEDKESACNAGDLGLIPGSGDLLEKGMVTHWGYSCLENSSPWGHKELDRTGQLTFNAHNNNQPKIR